MLGIGRASKIPSPANSLLIYLNRLICGENILVSVQRFNANDKSNNNKNGYHLLSLFSVPGTVPSALHLPHLLVTTTLSLLSFIIPTLPVKELRFWATSQGHKLVKWLDQDSISGHLHGKLRHLSATQFCLAGSHTSREKPLSEFYKLSQVWRHRRGGRIHRKGPNRGSLQGSYNTVGKTYVKYTEK